MLEIIGLKIIAVRGVKNRKNAAKVKPEYILFDDGRTFIQLSEQDPYSYRDCSPAAREIAVFQDAKRHAQLMSADWYGNATEDF